MQMLLVNGCNSWSVEGERAVVGGMKLDQQKSLPEAPFHSPHTFPRGYSLPKFPVTACTPRFSPSEMGVIWVQLLSGGNFAGSFMTMERLEDFAIFPRGRTIPWQSKKTGWNSPPSNLLFVTGYVCVYGVCYQKTDWDLEKLQLFRKAWDTNQPTEYYFNVTSGLLTNS